MKIAVTGPTGYIGSNFAPMAQAQGHEIVFLSRAQPQNLNGRWIPYDLNDSNPPNLPGDVEVILHLAFQAGASRNVLRINELQSAKNILSAGKKINARVIFLSSQTASKDSLTDYGRTKWEIEQLVIDSGNIAVRPGLVYGGEAKGLFLNLINTLKNCSFIPALSPSPKIQPIHVVDLCNCLLKVMALQNSSTKIFFFGERKSTSFTSFMQFLAINYLDKKIVFIPIPTLLALWLLKPLKYRWAQASQLVSLITLPTMNTDNSLGEIDYELMPYITNKKQGTSIYRAALLEGFIVYSYITRQKPLLQSLRSYARLIQHNRNNLSLGLPSSFLYFPQLLCAYDIQRNQNAWIQELNWRTQAASLLIEASPQGAIKLIKTSHDSFLAAGVSISIIVFKELFLRALGAIVRSWIATLPPSSWRNKL
ncbi:NAD(P)-dependent oxidoreductase [Polynucleobacter sp. AP-Melu-500A-A1]|uniref:NAD-dependent epimerase/dehydratase family protein n=1 Tax=Polynucleobacter sp. AP-Melu-500A-A1 TaxID=2576929 RepID=UPI001C0DEA6A|nr:NAD(P)-dependent oxidoreductase [Polynucleobacter sp. AP-Melu-500A-A1]MBU3630093.1 NAD(P)-dependent oxidoreductase [Polynucleobacter sp. AP-Melu-500A-A1]